MKSFFKNLLIQSGLLGKGMNCFAFLKSLRLDALLRNRHYRLRSGPDGLPIPSLLLRFMVSGNMDIAHFLKVGRLGADSIKTTLENNGLDIKNFKAILDFGCGCGRVIRHWNTLQDTQVFGTDYNPDLIHWCRNNLRFAEFKINGPAPPLDFENEQFDCIYSLSVFTHMEERLQFDWMKELSRILKPGGYLVFSTHGEHYLGELKLKDQERFKAGQVVVLNKEVAGTNYCGAYHPQTYVENTLSRGFRVIDFVQRGAKGNPHQDIYLFQKL